jgi:hypothetical protein
VNPDDDDMAELDSGPVEMFGHMHSWQGIPPDARLMGLDRNTEEGALVALAGSLQSGKLSHRVVAWLLLLTMVMPLLLTVRAELF